MAIPRGLQDLEHSKFNAEGDVKVSVQDQHTPVLIVPFQKVSNTTALTVAGVINEKTITIADITGFVAGKIITISDVASGRYMVATQVGALIGNVVLLDSPLDFAWPIVGTVVTAGSDNLAVDGSVTPQIFSLRASNPNVPVTIDVTRIIFHGIATSPLDLSLFVNLPALLNGLVLRRIDGTYSHIFNIKTNHDFAGLMYDFQIYAATNPVQGVDGFVGRMTFAGQNKMGVVLRLGPGEDLQLIAQDALQLITLFHATAEGHVVDPT